MWTVPRDAVVDFFAGGRDHRGRSLDGILTWDDDDLESVHDYIQWLFPTRQPSAVNPFAPLVTDATVTAFLSDATLRERLRRAFERMLRFYGLRENDGPIEPDPERFAARSPVWLHPGNHNHLRLTRIMESLATLGLQREARALQRCLVDHVAPASGRVSRATLDFWKRAVS
jgi:hypothetical protein